MTDKEMIEKALSTLRFTLQACVDDPEDNWPAITELADELKTYLGVAPIPGEEDYEEEQGGR